MRNNKAILEDAARSVRRTFVGSIAGSVVMLGVVGAAGAYGMPDKLTAQALTAAMTTFNVKFSPMLDRAGPIVERAKAMAQNAGSHASMVHTAEITALIPPRRDAVVATVVVDVTPDPAVAVVPAPPAQPVPPPVQEAAPAVAPVQVATAAPTFVMPKPARAMPGVEPMAVAQPVEPVVAVTAEPVKPAAPVEAEKQPTPEPMPAVPARMTPRVVPPAAADRPIVSAALIFEMPEPDKIPGLTEMPKTEPVTGADASPDQTPTVVLPKPSDFSKTFWAHLMQSKPPLSPAQRLELHGKDYDKAEHCLAQAVYFEARNEPTRGQEAVAQVVLNRVFSPYYPKDVCSVVYQNAHRHLSCQFTFACDGKPEAVTERGAWARANRVAKAALDAKVWLPEVNKATHYHAAYVRPNWIREMRVMVRYGLHTFYRPRNWGDGSDEPSWGTHANSVKKGRV